MNKKTAVLAVLVLFVGSWLFGSTGVKVTDWYAFPLVVMWVVGVVGMMVKSLEEDCG